MEAKRNSVVKGIRACLISTKGMLPIRQLEKDYYTMMGEKIPYGSLGFKNLADLIKSEESLSIRTVNGETLVDARMSEKSSHIQELVNKQKTSKKKVSRPAPIRYTQYTPPPRMSATTTTKWRPKFIVDSSRKYVRSNRPEAVSHNQFVNNPPVVASKVVIPEHSALHRNVRLKKLELNHTNNELENQSKKNGVGSRLNINGTTERIRSTRSIITSHLSSNNNVPSRLEDSSKSTCTSLMSTRKRITQKMSEISLDRDSGNSSPTELVGQFEAVTTPVTPNTPVAPITPVTPIPPITTFVTPKMPEPTGDPIKDVQNLTEFYKLDNPIYESKLIKGNFFSCILKIGKHTYRSYPTTCINAKAAQIVCAESALQELPTLYNKIRKPSLLLSNDKDILERIPPMLEKHYHGIWDWQLKEDYRDKYKEELPDDFLKIIDMSPCIQLEKCTDNYIVRHCEPGKKGMKRNNMMTISDVSVPSNTVDFGEDGKLSAEVTCVIAANEIWCRQHGTEETAQFNDIMGRMELHYERYGHEIKAETVRIGAYYVTKFENAWYRVRTIKDEESEVLCFFIDDGDEVSVSKSDLYQLKREYATAQAQAFVCRLVGLEDLYEMSANSEQLQQISYTHVLLELATDAKNIDDDVTLPIYMYEPETGESINEKMISLLSLESALPEIRKDTITEVYVSHIESNGDVYVQLHSAGYERLHTLLENLETEVIQNPPTNLIVPIKKEQSFGKLYFAKYAADGHWYRIQIIDWSPCQTLAQIYFVDYGNTDVIKIASDIIYPLDKLSDVLNLYPFQAVKVKMAISEIPDDFRESAVKAMPADQPILLKIINYDEVHVPEVEFFKRNADGGLFCINKSISVESEMKKVEDSNNNKKRNRISFDSKNVPSSGKLESPELPTKGDYFEVHVPFAVNPYNFFVQPLKSQKALNDMMRELQERYKEILYSPLTVDEVIPGNIYASRHEDGLWYRTSVIKVIHAGSISVFYCDFGYYANLTVQKLIPLDIEFMMLPYQAMKAKIANIKPKQSQWTMDDCTDFKEMVEGKNFYSIFHDVEKDVLYKEDLVLNLILIDTSSDDDILIGDELIKKDVAVSAQV